jgi:OOP family OmpA-OmpF porin
LLVLLVGWLTFVGWRNHRWRTYVEALGRQPGVVVTSFGRRDGRFVISGLRDPLSSDPLALLQSAGLDPQQAQFHWGAYYALDDPILQQRAVSLLRPPSGVNITVADGILSAQGVAPDDWFTTFSARASTIPGIRGVDVSLLIGASEAEFRRLKTLIQSTVLTFPVGSAELSPAQSDSLKLLSPEISALLLKAQVLHKNANIEIVGHSDSTGAEATNQLLSQERADSVARQLAREGLPRGSARPVGVASAQPLRPETDEEARQSNRSVTFSVSATAPPKS